MATEKRIKVLKESEGKRSTLPKGLAIDGLLVMEYQITMYIFRDESKSIADLS